jgi:alpha-tubulin suppressor-like RCC1 family protein
VQCWGYNFNGELGNGTNIDSTVPVQTIASGSGVTSLAVSSNHACAVVNGGVRCWGFNGNGQLGDGSTTSRTQPVQTIPAGSGVTAVVTGGTHSCALAKGGVQ